MRARTAEDERSKYVDIQNFIKPLLDMIAQCNEAHPRCKPCLKAKAACEYEFSAGQTRNQALSENQRRLQGQSRTFTSLIYALRCADSNASGRILRHLRRGDYDGTLLCDDSSSDMTRHADKGYPWEDLSQDERPQSESRYTTLPPVSDLISMQRNSAEHPIPQMIPQMPGYLDQNHQEYSMPSQMIALPFMAPSEFSPFQEQN
jgi:hypothetical protein